MTALHPSYNKSSIPVPSLEQFHSLFLIQINRTENSRQYWGSPQIWQQYRRLPGHLLLSEQVKNQCWPLLWSMTRRVKSHAIYLIFFWGGLDFPTVWCKKCSHTSTFSCCYGSAMHDVIPASIAYLFILNILKCNMTPKHISDFFCPEIPIKKEVSCTPHFIP